MIDTAPNQVTRFAPKESTPVDRARARAMANQSAILAAFIADVCLTNDTLWGENERLQAGIDRNLELVAELRGQLGLAEARAKAAGTFGMLGGVTLAPDVIAAFRMAAAFAREKRYLAVTIDVEHIEALLVVFDKFDGGING